MSIFCLFQEAGGVEMLHVNSGGSLLYGDTQMGVQSAVSR